MAYRIWCLYTAGLARSFLAGRSNLYRVLLSKPDHGENYLPLTREDWYVGDNQLSQSALSQDWHQGLS
jgi:hypothetical protein